MNAIPHSKHHDAHARFLGWVLLVMSTMLIFGSATDPHLPLALRALGELLGIATCAYSGRLLSPDAPR